MFQDMSRN